MKGVIRGSEGRQYNSVTNTIGKVFTKLWHWVTKGGTYFPFRVIFDRVDGERRDNGEFREGITCVFERGWITNGLINFLRRVLFSAEINPRDPTSRGMSDTVNPFSSMSLTRGQYFRDLYSCIFSTFVSNGTDNSKIRISFSCSRNTHMSGQRFVVPHSIGIVEIPFFWYLESARCTEIRTSSELYYYYLLFLKKQHQAPI